MTPFPNVLIYGRDATLVQTRAWVLERVQFHVESVADLPAFETVLAAQQVDLVILCHTLTTEECVEALAITRRRPDVKSLALAPDISAFPVKETDEVLSAFVAPWSLIAAVQKMTTEQALPALNLPTQPTGGSLGSI